MTSNADGTTITIEDNTIPVDEFEGAMNEILDAGTQLTFDLGVPRRGGPDFATLKITGQLPVTRNLLYSEHVTVQIVDRVGEVLAEAPATVGYPTFKDHYDKSGGKTIERVHTAALD